MTCHSKKGGCSCQTYGTVIFKEITREGYDGAKYFREFEDITIRTPAGPWPGVLADTAMGPGETQTLALYYGAPHRSFILTDDGRAARFCRKQGLPFINALLVPKVLYHSGKLDEQTCRECMASLAGLGWYSTRILDLAFQMNREDLDLFLFEETP